MLTYVRQSGKIVERLIEKWQGQAMAYVETAKPVQPCEAAILSLLFAVANWCFSLLFRTGSEPPNVLEGKGFSALPESLLSLHSRKSPCKWRWQGGSQVSTP